MIRAQALFTAGVVGTEDGQLTVKRTAVVIVNDARAVLGLRG
jgi:hypothetical protein